MATSGVYVTTLSFTQLLTDALVDIGILDAEDSPNANQLALGIRKFNHLLYQLKGPKAHYLPSERGWMRETVSLTPAAKISYSLKPSGGDAAVQIPTEIITVLLRHTSTSFDSVLTPFTQQEYYKITNKTATGKPARYFYEKRLSEGVLYFDTIPTAEVISDYTFQITYRQALEVVTDGAETLDLPYEWYRAFEWTLAREMAPGYTIDDATWQRVVAMSSEALGLSNNNELENPIVYYQAKRDIDD